jgi:hypothetical protein
MLVEHKCSRFPYSMICINLWKHCNRACRQKNTKKTRYVLVEHKCPLFPYSMMCINLWKHCNRVCRQIFTKKKKFNQSPRFANDLDLGLWRWGRAHVMGVTWWRYVPSMEGLRWKHWFGAVKKTLTWLQKNFNQSPRSINDLDLELGRWGPSHVMGVIWWRYVPSMEGLPWKLFDLGQLKKTLTLWSGRTDRHTDRHTDTHTLQTLDLRSRGHKNGNSLNHTSAQVERIKYDRQKQGQTACVYIHRFLIDNYTDFTRTLSLYPRLYQRKSNSVYWF